MTSSLLRTYREPLRPDDESFVQQSLIRSLPYRQRFERVALSNAMVLLKLALRSPEKRQTATAAPPLVSHTSSSYIIRRIRGWDCSRI
jgi:hypothetical protein